MTKCDICKSDLPDDKGGRFSPRDLHGMEPKDERSFALHSVATSIVMFNNPSGATDEPLYWICQSCLSRCFSPGRSEASLRVETDVKNAADAVVACASGAIFNAAKAGDVSVVKAALDAGIEANWQDDEGRTPLHLASSNGCIEVVKLLLSSGANVHAQDRLGRTPLHGAAFMGHADVAAMLLDAGADVDAKGAVFESGKRIAPLAFAVIKGQTQVVQLLLDRGADIDGKTEQKGFLISVAEQQKHRKVAELLTSRKKKKMWKWLRQLTTKRTPKEILLDFPQSIGRSREKLRNELLKCLKKTAQKGELSSREREEMLLAFLSDPDVNIRAGVCLALGELGSTPRWARFTGMINALEAGFKPSDAEWGDEIQKRQPETKSKKLLEELASAKTTPELLQRTATAALRRLEQRDESAVRNAKIGLERTQAGRLLLALNVLDI
jgi:hypothetical protein